MSIARTVRAPRGTQFTCKSWLTEAPMRMLMNNLDPDVAEKPDELIVYGGRGKAARNWDCYDAIIKSLRELEIDETLLVQSGKPVGVFKSHPDAPRVLIANSNIVPGVGNARKFRCVGKSRLDHVRADDGGQLDLHRHARNFARHVRNARVACATARLVIAQRQIRFDGGTWRNGWRATARRDDE